jgi:hypothetical protein
MAWMTVVVMVEIASKPRRVVGFERWSVWRGCEAKPTKLSKNPK